MIYLQMIESREDKHKFEILYQKYRGLMFYIANHILNHPQDAEDAVHTAFVAIAEHIGKIGDINCPKTKAYVVTIVESKAIDIYRRKQRNKEVALEDDIIGIPVSYDGPNAIAGCIARLPGQYRDILMLKYRYGYTNREIAQILHISEGNAIKRIQRAKQKLNALCVEEGAL